MNESRSQEPDDHSVENSNDWIEAVELHSRNRYVLTRHEPILQCGLQNPMPWSLSSALEGGDALADSRGFHASLSRYLETLIERRRDSAR